MNIVRTVQTGLYRLYVMDSLIVECSAAFSALVVVHVIGKSFQVRRAAALGAGGRYENLEQEKQRYHNRDGNQNGQIDPVDPNKQARQTKKHKAAEDPACPAVILNRYDVYFLSSVSSGI